MRPAAWACGSIPALYSGYRIPPHYDSMIAKLIVHGGNSRNEALMRLRRALGEYVIDGVKTTLPLHIRLVHEPTSSTATTTSTGWSGSSDIKAKRMRGRHG